MRPISRRRAWALAMAAAAWTLASSMRLIGANCSSTIFVQGTEYPAGIAARSVAVGQFTFDAIPDVVVSGGFGGPGIALLPGNGDGTLGAAQPIADIDTDLLIASDLNGDGKDDLVFRLFGQEIGVLINNGDGTFGALTSYVLPGEIEGIVAVDLTGNGKPDLVISFDDNFIQVLPANGDGTFGAPISSVIGGTSSGAIAVADLDGDGKVDLVTAFPGFVAVSRGNGDRTFGAGDFYPVAPALSSVAIGDIDGDGHPDIGVTIIDYAEVRGGYVGILLNNGDGTFEAAVETEVGGQPDSLTFADFDGDGRLDATVTAGGFAVILMGEGRPTFERETHYLGANAVGLKVADLDGDGHLDIVTADAIATESASVLLGNGDGTLRAASGLLTGNAEGIASFAAGDFNGDGLEDLVVLGQAGAQIYIGRPGGFDQSTLLFDGNSPISVVLADFNNDGKLDVALNADGNLFVFLGRGDGTFDSAARYPIPLYNPGGLLTADFNGDGAADIGVEGFGGTLLVMFGNGDGTFGSTASTSSDPGAYGIGDFNGDGKPDIALLEAQGLGGTLRILLGHGDGTFDDHADYSLPYPPYGLTIGDATGDGIIDVVVADGGGGLFLAAGHGDGTLADPVAIPTGHFVISAGIGDFDGDGIFDLLTANSTVDGVAGATLLVGTGGGDFGAPLDLLTSSDPRTVLVTALAGTTPDALIGGDNGAITILRNSRLTALVTNRSVIVGGSASLVASASGFGPLTYQWRKNGTPLSDGGAISGSHTATLTIDPVEFADAGSYDVVVTDSCTSVTSNAANLFVEFADVPLSSIFHDDIIAVATAGITAGCGGSDFCPTNPVRRDQMAVFLLKSEHGAAYTPPACSGVFADVPCPGPFTDWVERLAAEGVTGGCGGSDYCPGNPVTRAQMAVFLLKTLLGSGYTPPPATGIFGDVPVGSFAADFIEDLYNRGITGGCSTSPLLYCPGNAVLRQQMAALIVRTFLTP